MALTPSLRWAYTPPPGHALGSPETMEVAVYVSCAAGRLLLPPCGGDGYALEPQRPWQALLRSGVHVLAELCTEGKDIHGRNTLESLPSPDLDAAVPRSEDAERGHAERAIAHDI